MTSDRLDDLERRLGVQFRDKELLVRALTHSSYLNERSESAMRSNERLEFVGDALLDLVVARTLFDRLPNEPEGMLTARRSLAVRGEAVARIAASLSIGEYLLMGTGERAGGGATRPANLAGAMESVIGAVLLDRGYDVAFEFVERVFRDEIDLAATAEYPKDPKSRLQEFIQARGQTAPEYRTAASEGPDHDRSWRVDVLVQGEYLASGGGRRKIDAERQAAEAALMLLEGDALESAPDHA